MLWLFLFAIMSMSLQPDKQVLMDLAKAKMPFGKYKGYYLSNLPEAYLVWFRQQGFPNSKLSKQMLQVLELKENGLEGILTTIRNSM